MLFAKSQLNASGINVQGLVAVLCVLLIAPGDGVWMATARAQTPEAPQEAA